MTTTRRDVLKTAIVAGAAASLGFNVRGASAQAAKQIDGVLRQAVDAREVPGVVAMVATDKGVLYEGAFGARALDAGPAMTLDSYFRIASMTKAIASVAAMQLVEQGKLKLDEPVPNIDPTLGSPQVLDGFDASGAPKLRPAKRAITLRHLLTHTAGFGYEQWYPTLGPYIKATGLPPRATGKLVTIRMPLVFDPGDRWLYGISIDWVGRLVEAISGQPLETVPAAPEFWSAGGPLYSTGRDYLTFLQALLHGGSVNGVRLLKPETVAELNRNATGNIPCGVLKTEMPNLSNDVDFFPGAPLRWGLGYMLNVNAGPNGRSAGTVSWGGLFNTYYWLDPVRRVTGLIMTQILPFADQRVLKLYGRLESTVYEVLKTG